MIAKTPSPPYYAVIFTSIRTPGDSGYTVMSDKMIEEVKKQPGFLGFESARNETGITVSYWTDLESIRKWRIQEKHTVARNTGREKWYQSYKARICLVERDYEWEKEEVC
jgi:heme-degrading monooxygenase HmoA